MSKTMESYNHLGGRKITFLEPKEDKDLSTWPNNVILENGSGQPLVKIYINVFKINGKREEVELRYNVFGNYFLVSPSRMVDYTYTDERGNQRTIALNLGPIEKCFRDEKPYTEWYSKNTYKTMNEFMQHAQYREAYEVQGFDRPHMIEVVRDFLYRRKYRVDANDIDDSRTTSSDVFGGSFSNEDKQKIANEINSYIAGNRGYNGAPNEELKNTPENESNNANNQGEDVSNMGI